MSLKIKLIEGTQDSFSDFSKVFEKTVDSDYESFVNQLKQWAGDPKVTNFLRSGLTDGAKADDKFTVSQGAIPCHSLIPTQNEIDLTKSLSYSLKDAEAVKSYLQGSVIEIAGAPIITFNGKYIIDGHHRWSQVYCINPNAKMKVLNFKKSGLSPTDMLKATQVAVAATSGEIQVQKVDGNNLLTMDLKLIMKYVIKNITDEVAKLFQTKEKAAKHIAINSKKMQKLNKPISGAPSREYMPQTDEPKGNLKNVANVLSKGIGQAVKPFEKTSNSEPVTEARNYFNGKGKYDYSKMYDNKDKFRIEDIIEYSKGNLQKAVKIAKTMASKITDKGKALRRGYAAADLGYSQLANIFFNRSELLTESIYSKKDILIMENVLNKKWKPIIEAKKILKEEDEVEAIDPIVMFQEMADISGNLADIYSTLVQYKTGYISNPKVQKAIMVMMNGVNTLMKQSTSTMQMLGVNFGLNESKKPINEKIDLSKMEEWSPETWSEWEALDPVTQMKMMMPYLEPVRAPKYISKVINACKTWAKSNYKGWERVSTTQAGKESIMYQFLKSLPIYKHFTATMLKPTIKEICAHWKK